MKNEPTPVSATKNDTQQPGRRRLLLPRLLLVLLAAVAVDGWAAWSDDPAANLAIADDSGDQVQAKVVATTDGGCYVSWFDNATGGYDVYLQRLDINGDEQWAHNGVLVADRGFSSTQDYGLAIDTAGNALLAFRDDSSGSEQIAAAKVAPDGTLEWGGAIQLTATTAFVAAPKIAGTSDGNLVVAWTEDTNVVVNKLDPAGTPLWASAVSLGPTGVGSFMLSDLQAAEQGKVIVSWVFAPQFMGPNHLWAQKLASADGALLWPSTHVQVYDEASGSLQMGNFPYFITDHAGGAVFAWYTTSPLQCRVQRILSGGTEAFAHNGVEAATTASQIRVSPNVAFNPTTQEIFLAWREQNQTQSQSGVNAQKFSANGTRQWTDSGKVLVALAANEISWVTVLPWDTGAVVTWVETLAFGNQPVHASRLDSAGDPLWSPAVIDLATSATATSRFSGALSSSGFAIYVWSDGESGGSSDIYGQNLNRNGTLGPSIFADGFESGDLLAWSASAGD